jgi:putative endonuclease
MCNKRKVMGLGQFGEEKAVKYLISNGYTILCRNFRCKSGEIDIVAKDKTKSNLIVFFEVKTRRNRGFGLPCEAVTALKIQKIKKVIKVYTSIKHYRNCDCRIDVIEILLINKKMYIRHLKNIF